MSFKEYTDEEARIKHEQEMRAKYPVHKEIPFDPLVLEALREGSTMDSGYICTCATDPKSCPFHTVEEFDLEEPMAKKKDALAHIPQTAQALSARVDRNLEIEVNPELGERLTQAALSKIRDRHSQQLIQFVAATMDNIRHFKNAIADNQRYLRFQERRLEAINAGRFSLDRNLLPVFDEAELNG